MMFFINAEFSGRQDTKPFRKAIKRQVSIILKNAPTLPVRWNELCSQFYKKVAGDK